VVVSPVTGLGAAFLGGTLARKAGRQKVAYPPGIAGAPAVGLGAKTGGIEAERWCLVVEGALPYAPGRGTQAVEIRGFLSAPCQPVVHPRSFVQTR
jgi:hypothetical protein